MKMPQVVSAEEWQEARDALLVKEKALTKAQDALAAERRRLPMVEWDAGYVFEGPDGKVTLLDLFEGRRQLIVYHFMPFTSAGPCPGCSFVVDTMGRQEPLHNRDISRVVTSMATVDEIDAMKKRMEWTVPWYSALGSTFTDDCGVESFGVSVFLREGDKVYRTYFTTGRGGDQLLSTLRYIDLTPLGRQEAWEEESRGDDGPGYWWRPHDEY
ncbi:DUF899 domain-containing protein [Amycolatopsis sp. NPDC059657]|uniref:DUF899 domain-containing protein n=1 Tax=Amycolatopsis sp. NPDC059657 TaxID=3346899 RepID=UPI00366E2CA0